MNKCDVCPYGYLDNKGKFKCKWKICMLEFDGTLREQVYKVLSGSKDKCKCWRCGKEFYSDNVSDTLCDDCMGRNSVITTFEPVTQITPSLFMQNILLVEEGSVDIEQLEKLNIKYLVYRKGSQKPEIIKPIDIK